MLDEGLLHWMKTIAGCEALDCADRSSLDRSGQRETRQYAAAVDVYGARATLAVIAALLGAGEPQVLAPRIEQGDTRIECHPDGFAVDRHHHVNKLRS